MQNALLSRPERSRSTDKQRLLGAVRLESTALAGEAELTKVRGEFERYLAARYQVTLHRMQTFQRSGWLRRWADASSLSARRRQLLRRAVARLIHSTLWRFVEQWRDAATQRSYYRRRQTPQLLALLRTQVRRVPTPAYLPARTHARTHASTRACHQFLTDAPTQAQRLLLRVVAQWARCAKTVSAVSSPRSSQSSRGLPQLPNALWANALWANAFWAR
jgi:hypothetical protein